MAKRKMRVKVGERWYSVEIDEPIVSPTKVSVDGNEYLVEVDDPASSQIPRVEDTAVSVDEGKSINANVELSIKESSVSEKVISSPMPGKVLSINVRPGDEVSVGDEVCVLEAMKMNQSILSPRNGKISKIHVKPLQQVTINEALMELE